MSHAPRSRSSRPDASLRTGTPWPTSGAGAGAAAAVRGWPVGPDQLDGLTERRPFTSGTDWAAVRALFRRMGRAQLGGVTVLHLVGMPPPTPEHAVGLAGRLRLCARLETLNPTGCQIGREGAEALAGALPFVPALRELHLEGNDLGVEGARALAAALPSSPGLRVLRLGSNGIGDGAEAAVRAAWGGRGPNLLLWAGSSGRASSS
ncbi:unnamed protein product [Prorocentrum cordatum]|uniref:Uncharacterized protein n=1 Tax=Prorocentrum cordatum TaxID=2364126 RepID=A0ABN9V9U2_9DINO|nr:unnamed protein product [Polarella glacialis]